MKLAKQLNENPSERLKHLEVIVEEGLAAFVDVGLALAEIKAEKLYIESGFTTWEDYTRERWSWTRQYATKYLGAAAVIAQLPESTAKAVTSVNAANALRKVPSAMRPAVVEAAKGKDGKATEAAIKAATPKKLPPPPSKKKPANKAVPVIPSGPKDETGVIIPPEVLPLWNRRDEVQQVLAYVSALRSKVEKAQAFKDVLFASVNFSSVMSALNQVYTDIKATKPYAVCPTCQGRLSDNCGACKGLGLVGQFYWDACVPSEVKEMRKRILEQHHETNL